MTIPSSDEVARMVAKQNASADAAETARRAQSAADLARSDRPVSQSRWHFGIRCAEEDGCTLTIRCYPRKIGFTEDDSPFPSMFREPIYAVLAIASGALCFGVAWLCASLIAWAIGGCLWLLVVGFAHYSRVLHIRVTNQNHFIIYERSPARPIGLGDKNSLQMDVHLSIGLDENGMRCMWTKRSTWFRLTGLRRSDVAEVERFISVARLRGL